MSLPCPLSDCTVLDLTEGGINWCGKVLADFGADVIKVEPPGGSPTREVGPFVDGLARAGAVAVLGGVLRQQAQRRH